MTKLVKLSLVAAIAVSGLSSTVAAKPLEEAIKGVDISGSVVYRYDDRQDDEGTTASTSNSNNHYEADVFVKVPVNDIVTFNAKIAAGEAFGGLNAQNTGDVNPSVNLQEANFSAVMGNLTVIAGKQQINTPFTVGNDSSDDDNTGTGIVALYNAGFATFAAAYFNQTQNLAVVDGKDDVAALAVIAPVGPVNLDIWYVDVESELDAWTVGLSGSAFGISAMARYTEVDPDSKYGLEDQDLWQVKLSGDLGPVGLMAHYANGDSDGSIVSLNDCDAATGASAWNVDACNKLDASFWAVSADIDLMEGLNFALNYANVDHETAGGADIDEDEVYGQLTYDMSDNLSTYIRYGVYDQEVGSTDTIDQTRGRLNVEYSF